MLFVHNDTRVRQTVVDARATFQGDINGSVTLTQGLGGGAVTIKVALSGLDPAQGPFPWHVHTLPVTAAGGCAGTGGHYNFTAGEGELSIRHGDLPNTSSVHKTYTDTFLSLSGEGSVLGRSIVLHNDTSMIACATLAGSEDVRFATASFGAAHEPTGTITLTQGATAGPTVIEVVLTGLVPAEGPFPWHVHTVPVPAAGGCDGTGGHYYFTAAEGELSIRHGDLPTTTSVTTTYTDTSGLSLFGGGSVIGRSIVLHKNDNSTMACATLVEGPAAGITTTAAPTASPSASPTATPTQSPVVPGASAPSAPHAQHTILSTLQPPPRCMYPDT